MSSSKRQSETDAKRSRALALHLQGRSYQRIADELGYASRSGAHAAVRDALSEQVASADLVEAYRVEAYRVDVLIQALTPGMESGDVQSADRYLKAIQRRTELSALLATADAPEVVEVKSPLDELTKRRAARGAGASRKGRAEVAGKRG